MKNNLRTIGYIAAIVFTLLWINQLFSGLNLYVSEKTQWQRNMDSIIEGSMDSYLRSKFMEPSHEKIVSFSAKTYVLEIWNGDTTHTMQIDTNETIQSIHMRALYDAHNGPLDSLSRLDSILHKSCEKLEYPIRFISQRTDSLGKELARYPQNDINLNRLTRSKAYPLGYLSGESISVYYDYPLSIFLAKAWHDILSILGLTLLMGLGIGFMIYFYRMQRRLSKIQENMMQQIVHDWKTPLNTIGMASELLQKKSIAPTDEKGLKKVEIIREETEHLKTAGQQLLNTISELTQIRIEKTEFDLQAGLSSLVKEQETAHANKKNITLTLEYALPETTAYASRFHLFCAIRNLLDNAIKYSGEEAKVTIRCFLEGKTLVIQVQDNGHGIPEEEQKTIFDKYYRMRRDKTIATSKGYGLGLAYVNDVIKAHKGHISVESLLGKGSTFTIRLNRWKKR